ncbi:MAG TPA: diaminopimelate epimerase [Spirochaetota bacterium]|nr:diaminopimelate epimerase [Spirochaetota bacterium]HPJ33672.1 diaminopimelate epimerase [Spirochaetota bacterium]
MKFTKMHGAGNDYIYIEDLKGEIKKPSQLAVEMSNRNFGIGSDGLILIMKSEKGDFRMRMFNSDGSESEMCGNGIRCFAKYVYDHGLTDKDEIDIETGGGMKHLKLKVKKGLVDAVQVDMGEPVLQRERIPMLGEPGMVINEDLHLPDGVTFTITSVSMGNPHVIVFVEDVKNFPVLKYGPIIENFDLFPNRTNVEFVQILSGNEVIQRTWERGAGETMACGTGASAVTVAGVLTKQTERKITVHLSGGDLKTEWDESSNHVFMTGPAVEVFKGEWPG